MRRYGRKWDEDQPRANDGKWSDSGGGSSLSVGEHVSFGDLSGRIAQIDGDEVVVDLLDPPSDAPWATRMRVDRAELERSPESIGSRIRRAIRDGGDAFVRFLDSPKSRPPGAHKFYSGR